MINFCTFRNQPKSGCIINTTSRSTNWSRGLSPFVLGPVELYNGYMAKNVENAWQFAKVYAQHDANGPTKAYFEWATTGWSDDYAHRYPMGRGSKPLYSWWNGEKLSYVEARKKIYAPLYAKAVENTDAFRQLKAEHEKHEDIWLLDFDVYDFRKLGMSYQDVLNCDTKKMGHGFVLAMMLESQRAWE